MPHALGGVRSGSCCLACADAIIRGKSRMSQRSRTDLCGGCRATGIPTATLFSRPGRPKNPQTLTFSVKSCNHQTQPVENKRLSSYGGNAGLHSNSRPLTCKVTPKVTKAAACGALSATFGTGGPPIEPRADSLAKALAGQSAGSDCPRFPPGKRGSLLNPASLKPLTW